MTKIIYEPHPVNPARKAKLQAQGYKIIDAIFAPPGTPIHEKLEVVDAPVIEEPAEIVAEAESDNEDEAPSVIDDAAAKKRGRPRKGE